MTGLRRWWRPVYAGVLAALVLSVFVAAAGGSPSSTQSPKLTTVRWIYDWLPTSSDVPILAAEKNGYFAKVGLEVKTTPGGQVDQLVAVGSGAKDITIAPANGVLIDVAKGLPIKAVGVVQPLSPVGEICRPDRGIKASDPKTLYGKKVGIQPTDLYNAVWEVWMQKHHLDPSKIKQIPVSFDPVVMFKGQVDCFPDYLTLVPAKGAKEFGKPTVNFAFGKDTGTIGQAMIVNKSFAVKNPNAVKGFVWAYAKGLQWALRHRSQAIDLVVSTYSKALSRDVVQVELPALQKFWVAPYQRQHGLLSMTAKTWQPTYQAMLAGKKIKKPIRLSQVFTNAYAPKPAVMP